MHLFLPRVNVFMAWSLLSGTKSNLREKQKSDEKVSHPSHCTYMYVNCTRTHRWQVQQLLLSFRLWRNDMGTPGAHSNFFQFVTYWRVLYITSISPPIGVWRLKNGHHFSTIYTHTLYIPSLASSYSEGCVSSVLILCTLLVRFVANRIMWKGHTLWPTCSLLLLLKPSKHHLRPRDVLLGGLQVFKQRVLSPCDALVLVGLGVGESRLLACLPSKEAIQVGASLVLPSLQGNENKETSSHKYLLTDHKNTLKQKACIGSTCTLK